MSRRFHKIVSPVTLPNGIMLKNRLASSASTNNLVQADAADWPREAMITYFVNRAKSGAGMLTVTGAKEAANLEFYREVFGDPKFTLFDLSNPTTQVLFAQMNEAVHMYNCKTVFQLIPKAFNQYDVSGGDTQLNFFDFKDMPQTKEITKEMLEEIKKTMVEWADYARMAGFDGVSIHMCYRFSLAARLLSKRTNHRGDEYGGSVENMSRWPIELCREIKKRCGNRFIIEAVISGDDPEENGWKAEDTVTFAKLAEGAIDMLQIRNAEIDPSHPTSYAPDDPYPNLAPAKKVKAAFQREGIRMLVETIGGFLDPDVMENILESEQADIISSARIWISNPGYVKKLETESVEDIVPCIRCNKCQRRASHVSPQITCCSVNPRWGLEHRIDEMFDQPREKKNTAVVGAGPAGLKAALILAERGHSVTLYEKSGKLGGLLRTTEGVRFKWCVNRYMNWLVERVEKTPGIQVKRHVDVNAEILKQGEYDDVLIAIGSEAVVPNIPGIEYARDAVSAFGHEAEVGDRVVVIGGGEVGVDIGMHLAELGREVTVLEVTDRLAACGNIVHTYSHMKNYWESLPTFHAVLGAKTSKVTMGSVVYSDANGNEKEIGADTILYAVGMRAKQHEAEALMAPDRFRAYLIGDCGDYGGDIQRCNRSAYGAANWI